MDGHFLFCPQHLTPVLVQLYNDIEHTERSGAFYFKFSMRVTIANILKYLWAQPQHRCGGGAGGKPEWQWASARGATGVYVATVACSARGDGNASVCHTCFLQGCVAGVGAV